MILDIMRRLIFKPKVPMPEDLKRFEEARQKLCESSEELSKNARQLARRGDAFSSMVRDLRGDHPPGAPRKKRARK